MYKMSDIKYDKSPAKVAEEIPRKKLFVYLTDQIDLKNLCVIIKRGINKFYP